MYAVQLIQSIWAESRALNTILEYSVMARLSGHSDRINCLNLPQFPRRPFFFDCDPSGFLNFSKSLNWLTSKKIGSTHCTELSIYGIVPDYPCTCVIIFQTISTQVIIEFVKYRRHFSSVIFNLKV